jgi:predicted component of type VI protein secretion system
MTEEERQQLCADLNDPWSVTPEELAELAEAAADELDRLANVVAAWKELANERAKLIFEQNAKIDRLIGELEEARQESAPASGLRWWARSKRTEGAK